MHASTKNKTQSINLTLHDGDESVMAENVREADTHSPKRLAPGSTTSSNQQTFCYDVVAKRLGAVTQTKPAEAAASRPGEKWTGRSTDR